MLSNCLENISSIKLWEVLLGEEKNGALFTEVKRKERNIYFLKSGEDWYKKLFPFLDYCALRFEVWYSDTVCQYQLHYMISTHDHDIVSTVMS